MTFSRLFLYAAFFCLAACGGGGGGGFNNKDDDDESSSFDPPRDTAEPLEYQGAKIAAVLTATNVGYFIYNALANSEGVSSAQVITAGGGNASAGFSHAAASRGDIPEAVAAGFLRAQILGRIRSNTATGKKPLQSYEKDDGRFSIAAVSDSYDYSNKSSEKCDAGQIDTYLMLNQNGTGLMVLDYRNCREGSVITDGLITYDISGYNSEGITRATIRFNRMTTTIDGQDIVSSASIEYEYNYPIERAILNVVYAPENGGMLELENMTFETIFEGNITQGNFSETISGRIYDSLHGYINIATVRRIKYSRNIPVSGELTASGAEGSRVLLEFPGGIGFTVRLDANGDQINENSATFNLARLASGENADIGDDDGDGMHNSWEIFHGLDPSNPDDAAIDTDGDLVINRDEYNLGYIPDDGESVPLFSDIGLSISQFNDQLYPAGHSSSFIFILNNSGTEDAGSVSVRFTMPAGFSLQSITQFPSEFEGDCEIGLNIADCQFTDVGPYPARHVQIHFILPGVTGNYSYQAAVIHSSLLDVDEGNNTVSGQIEVRPATAELEAGFIGAPHLVPTTQNFSYSFEVKNTGALPATNVLMELEVPEGVTVIESTVDNGCELTGGRIVCSYPSLSPGQRREESIAVTPLGLGRFEATLAVTSGTPEINSTDNTAVQTWEVITPVSDMRVGIWSGETKQLALTGAVWSLWIFTYNEGPHLMPEAQVTIDLPPEIEVSSLEAESVGCAGTHPVVCNVTEVAPGANTYFYFKIFLSSSVPGIYKFPVTMSSIGEDPDLSNNTQMISAYIGLSTDTIQAQVDAAAEGETVEVPANYYLGDLIYSKSIRLMGVDGQENTFWAVPFGGMGLAISDAAGGEVAGFTFAHGGTAVRLINSSVHVHDNVFEKLRDSQMFISGLMGAVIENNIWRENTCSGAAISLFNQTDPIIRNNLFLGNNCMAIRSATLGSPSVIVNNHFIGNTTGIFISEVDRDAGAYIGNNIFSGNEVGIETITDCGPDCATFQSNLFYDNGQNFQNSPDQVGSNGNIQADPLFFDAANADFSLQSGSPAIDAGDVLHSPADDFNGNPRPVDGDGSGTGEPDIGAYELQ